MISPKRIKNIILFTAAVFVGVYIVNLIFIFKSAEFLVPFKGMLELLLGYSSIIVIFGYIVFVALFIWIVDLSESYKKLKIFSLLVALCGLCIIIAWLFFVFLERLNYNNYVFSTYLIYLPSLKRFASFQSLVLVSGYFTYWYSKKHKEKLFFEFIVRAAVLVLFVNTLLGNVTKFIDIILNEVKFASQYINSGGFTEKTPDFTLLKKWSSFIVDNTEEDSIIIHPKQSAEYPIVGNQPLVRYFLYPRTLVSTTFTDQYLMSSKKENIYYLFKKANNKPEEYFPSIETSFRKAYILFLDGTIKEYYYSDFLKDFDEIYDKIDIGVLKI